MAEQQLPKRQWCVELRRDGEENWMPIVWRGEKGDIGGLYDTEAEAQKHVDELKWAEKIDTTRLGGARSVFARAALWGGEGA